MGKLGLGAIGESRESTRCCEENVSVFNDVLTVCYAEGLIGQRMSAIEGCKVAANCAKKWIGGVGIVPIFFGMCTCKVRAVTP